MLFRVQERAGPKSDQITLFWCSNKTEVIEDRIELISNERKNKQGDLLKWANIRCNQRIIRTRFDIINHVLIIFELYQQSVKGLRVFTCCEI